MTIKIINATTGEIIERDLTDDELAQRQADLERTQLEAQALAAKDAAKEAVLAKLGLTADEVVALLG